MMPPKKPEPGGEAAKNVGSGDAATPARKSNRLQGKRNTPDSPTTMMDRAKRLKSDAVEVKHTKIEETSGDEDVKPVQRKVVKVVSSNTSKMTTAEKSPVVDPKYMTVSERLKHLSKHAVIDLKNNPGAKPTLTGPKIEGLVNLGIKGPDGKIMRVMVKGDKIQTMNIVRSAGANQQMQGAGAKKQVQGAGANKQMQGAGANQKPVAGTSSTKSVRPDVNPKIIFKTAPQKSTVVPAVVSTKLPQRQKPTSVSVKQITLAPDLQGKSQTAKVYTSKEKTTQELGGNSKAEEKDSLKNEEAVNFKLIKHMQSIHKSLDENHHSIAEGQKYESISQDTASEEVFDCSAAVVQTDVAAALKENPELIQQICELTAVSVADITADSLVLYGPVEHIHKAKYLMQQMKQKCYRKVTEAEMNVFQSSRLFLVSKSKKARKQRNVKQTVVSKPAKCSLTGDYIIEYPDEKDQAENEDEEEEDGEKEELDETITEEITQKESIESDQNKETQENVSDSKKDMSMSDNANDNDNDNDKANANAGVETDLKDDSENNSIVEEEVLYQETEMDEEDETSQDQSMLSQEDQSMGQDQSMLSQEDQSMSQDQSMGEDYDYTVELQGKIIKTERIPENVAEQIVDSNISISNIEEVSASQEQEVNELNELNELQNELKLEETNGDENNEVEYACDMCCISFSSEKLFRRHTDKGYHQASYRKWSEENPYQCSHCLRRSKHPRAVDIHLTDCERSRIFRRVHNGRIIEQDIALDTWNVIRITSDMVEAWKNTTNEELTDEDLEELIDEDQGKEDQDADFDPDDDDTEYHEDARATDGRTQINCCHCDKVVTMSAFPSHCIYNHSGWTYHCPLCDRLTNRRGAMLRHLLNTHKHEWKEGEVNVTIHGNISNTQLESKVYMAGPHRNDYPCAHCSQTFGDARDCAHHTFRSHTPKQFVCAWCSKMFGALHHLTFHSAASHGKVMVQDGTGSYTIMKEFDEMHKKDVQCAVCGEMYRSKVRHDKICMRATPSKKRTIKTEHPPITQEMVDSFPEAFKYIHECDQCGYLTTAKGLVSHRKFLHFNNSLYACKLCTLFGNTPEIMEAHLKRKHFRSKQFREGLDCTILDEMPAEQPPENGIVICVNSSCIRLPPSVKCEDYYKLLYDRKANVDNTVTATCNECAFVGKAHILQFHKQHVHGAIVEKCPLCKKCLKEDGKLSRHIATEHFEQNQLVYSTRNKPQRGGRDLKDRMIVPGQSDQIVQCHTCGKEMKQSYLRSHEKIHQKTCHCDECGASFRCNAELRKHLVRKHTPAELVCRQCDTGFQTTQDLDQHMKVTHDNIQRYECPHCPTAVFETERYLRAHMDRKHENPNRHSCDVCGKMFYEKCKRDQHMRVHLPDNAEGRFRAQCNICNKNFKSDRYLEQHMNLHTKMTLYECVVCQRQFNLLSTLKKHQLTHTDERPHPCTFPGCNKEFRTVTKLKYHRVTHTKESPHMCPLCGKAFTQAYTLKTHKCKYEKEEGEEISTLFPPGVIGIAPVPISCFPKENENDENVTMVLQNGQVINTTSRLLKLQAEEERQQAEADNSEEPRIMEVTTEDQELIDTTQSMIEVVSDEQLQMMEGEASSELMLQMGTKQEPGDLGENLAQYACGFCTYFSESFPTMLEHIQQNHADQAEQMEDQVDQVDQAQQDITTEQQEASPLTFNVIDDASQAPPTALSLVEETEGAEHVFVNELNPLEHQMREQQIQVQDEHGNLQYVTINVENQSGDEMIEIDANAFVTMNNQQ